MFNLGQLLNNVGNTVKSWFAPALPHQAQADYASPVNRLAVSPVSVGETLTPGLMNYYDREQRLGGQPSISPTPPVQHYVPPQATSSPQRLDINALTQLIQHGFQQYGNPPAATAAASFAKAGLNLPDQLLPAVLSIKETSGGKRIAPNSLNNYLNLGPNINYPSIDAMLNGGGNWGANGAPQKGFSGIMDSGLYNKYLNSGNLADFFQTFTPPAAHNASIPAQLNEYNTYRHYFQ